MSATTEIILKNLVLRRVMELLYLTMIPELAYTMLACARIGAIHSIIFGGFPAESIAGRIQDWSRIYCNCR